MRIISPLGGGPTRLLSAFLFRGRWLLGICQLVGAIAGRLFFRGLPKAFGFEFPNLRVSQIEFGLQLDIPLDRAGVLTFPIAHLAL
jgi:hypothetical protein